MGRHKFYISEELRKEVMRLHFAGYTLFEIKNAVGISKTTVYRVIKLNGAPSKRELQFAKREQIIQALNDGKSEEYIIRHFNCSKYTLDNIRLMYTDIRYDKRRNVVDNATRKPIKKKIYVGIGDEKTYKNCSLNDKGWDGLAKAVALQAVEDYKKGCERLSDEYTPQADKLKSEARSFAESAWCEMLTDLNVVEVMNQIDQIYPNQCKCDTIRV